LGDKGLDRDLLSKTKSILRKCNIRPKKRLGQNFIVTSKIIKDIVTFAGIESADVILEIGAGLGYLTEALLDVSRRVIAIEVDSKLAEILKRRLKDRDNLELLFEDFLSIELPRFDKVVSVPPYKISSPLIFKLMEYSFKEAILVLQKEFVERLVAKPGGSNYSRLSVMSQLKTQIEILEHIPPEAFYPEPEITSTITRLRPRPSEISIVNIDLFNKMVRDLFGQRRRRVRKAIIPFLEHTLKFKEEDIEYIRNTLPMRKRRVFSLSPKEFAVMANSLSEKLTTIRRG